MDREQQAITRRLFLGSGAAAALLPPWSTSNAAPLAVPVVESLTLQIVVDNATNKLYYYAIDKEGKIGDELKLRGTVNLQDVGKPSIKPIDAKPQK